MSRDRVIDLTLQNFDLKKQILNSQREYLLLQRVTSDLQMAKLIAEGERLATERGEFESQVTRNAETKP